MGGHVKGSILNFEDKAFIVKLNDKAKYFYFNKYQNKSLTILNVKV
jgi:hypothetical protein